jgi:hypothetical protein
MIQDRRIPLDVAQFLELRTHFFQLNQGYRKLINEYHKLKEDVSDFTKQEKSMDELKPLEETWHASERSFWSKHD